MHAFDYYPIYFIVLIAFIDHNSSQNRVKKEDEQEIDVNEIAFCLAKPVYSPKLYNGYLF